MARLSKEEWESLKADFITGAYTLSQLAKKYSVSKGAISQRAKKEQWQKMDPKETVELISLVKLNRYLNICLRVLYLSLLIIKSLYTLWL